MHNYKRILQQVRKKSFPEIKGRIIVIKTRIIPFWAAFIWLIPGVKIVFVHPRKMSVCTKKEVEATLAHELCHAVQGMREGYLKYLYFLIKYLTYDKEIQKRIEYEADQIAIDRGYFEGKYTITKKMEAIHTMSSRYMSSKQIKEYYMKTKKKSKSLQ